MILRNQAFDRYVRDFMRRFPEAVVVHIGCGLDSRFERVDNGRVEWYDLDLPDVFELRRKSIGDDGTRYHLPGCSVLDKPWPDMVSAHGGRNKLRSRSWKDNSSSLLAINPLPLNCPLTPNRKKERHDGKTRASEDQCAERDVCRSDLSCGWGTRSFPDR